MKDWKSTRTDDDIDRLLETYLRDHCGHLVGGYAALLDTPGGLECIGAMMRSNRRR